MMLIIGLIFLVALIVGVPIAFGMGLAGATGILFVAGLDPSLVARRMYGILSSFPLLAIPLFSMIGVLADRCGLLPELVKWLQMVLGRMKGGMAYINVAASLLMGGVSGTAVSDVAALGRLEIQMMTRAGYSVPFSAALTASTAVIAPIVPPSVAMVIFGLASGGISIGHLFMAGLIPGLLMALGMAVMAYLKSRHIDAAHFVDRPSPSVLIIQTLRILPFVLLPVIIVGGIIGGIFTVTESAAVGVVYTLLVGFVITRTLRPRDVYDAVIYSSIISSVVGMLMGSGAIVSWIMTRNQVTLHLANYLTSLTTDPTVFMMLAAVALIALGTIMDATALIVALAPLLVPIARKYGIDDLQFGLVFTMSCMIGMITPPVGILLFMTASIADISLEHVYKAILPFVLAGLIMVALLVLFPPLTLWVPSLLGHVAG